MSQPQILKSVIAVGVVFAVIPEDVTVCARDYVIEPAETIQRFVSERNGNNLKEKGRRGKSLDERTKGVWKWIVTIQLANVVCRKSRSEMSVKTTVWKAG
jgi:hypothetical protein